MTEQEQTQTTASEPREEPKRYVGTKTLKAWPRTLGEYHEYRGWQMPDDQDVAMPGYMVEYENGGEPNITGHEGYVSWSPADVFEGTYREIGPDTWLTRLDAEGRELTERLSKLNSFINSPGFDGLPLIERDALQAQQRYMSKYLIILCDRFDRARNHGIEPDTGNAEGDDTGVEVAETIQDGDK